MQWNGSREVHYCEYYLILLILQYLTNNFKQSPVSHMSNKLMSLLDKHEERKYTKYAGGNKHIVGGGRFYISQCLPA